MPVWDEYITPRDRELFARSGYGRRAGFGERPALLVIDVTYAFVGDRPEPILESVRRWPQSSGEDGWRAVRNIGTLLAAARDARIPIVYTAPVERRRLGRWGDKNARRAESDAHADRNTIVPEIAPRDEDLVIRKEKPSAFFGTPLVAYLMDARVDSVLVTGGTTSGCVRASAVDAFSYNFRVSVVEECVFDRGQASHALSLFDLHQKYADVVSLDEAVSSLSRSAVAAR